MSRDTLVKDEEGHTWSLDRLATQKWLEGHYSGLDHCCGWLEQKAAVLFSQRKHEQALSLQRLADEMKSDLRPQMVRQAEEHEVEYPSELQET